MNYIAITIGDINGIGIELFIKLWKLKKNNKFILLSNHNLIDRFFKRNNINFPINLINNNLNNFKKNCVNIYSYKAKNNEENAFKSLIHSYNLSKKGYFIGILTLPINKEKIIKKINSKFVGQTEIYQKLDNKKYPNMLFIKNNLIFATLTTHIRLNEITKHLSSKIYLYNKIISLNKTLINDFDIINPKIIISGINPHAGENNCIGDEETIYLKPVIKKLIKNNIKIYGPYSGDAVLTKKNMKKYNCFVFNYHDQALIPFKMISNNSGINYTSGLSIIRVSPDHGTAYDIVGKNKGNIKGLINCVNLIKKIYKNRKRIVNS